MSKLKNSISKGGGFIKKHGNKLVLVSAIILAILYMRQCGNAKYEKKKNKQNIEALTKEVEVVKLKNGDMMSQKATLLASKKDLEHLNSDLKKEYDILRKEKSKPKLIIKTKIVYRDTGSVVNRVVQLDSNKYSLRFSYIDSDSILSIKGRSEFFATPRPLGSSGGRVGLNILPGKTFFDTTEIKIGLILGVKEDKDGIDRIFAKSNPFTNKVTFDDLDAVQLEEYYKSKYNNHKDKNKGKLSLGVYGGYGFGMSNYGVVRLGPNIGVGINYRLIRIPFF